MTLPLRARSAAAALAKALKRGDPHAALVHSLAGFARTQLPVLPRPGPARPAHSVPRPGAERRGAAQ
jgi:hypothetical protein